jgi:hypothetical protein
MSEFEIDGPAFSRPTIKVYGVFGSFSVLPNNEVGAPIRVRYFSTIAGKEDDQAAGNIGMLLNELKPMRERVKASSIKDLSTLLQRDLSDYRVANQLIPYLSGNSQVGFFPPILTAIMPKGFLNEDKECKYPVRRDEENGLKQSYGGFWDITYFKTGSNILSLGELSIDASKTDIIVLDGQHRANAFRFLTNTFEDAKGSKAYSEFYKDCLIPDNFDSQLPVTVVWFERDDSVDIDPKLISRRLFVDVNTTAVVVNASRNILLNDRSVSPIATSVIYSGLAQNGFSSAQLSLLHGGFDCDGDFPKGFPNICFFSPVTLDGALRYFLLSADRYDNLNVSIRREVESQSHGRLRRYVPKITDDDISKINQGDAKVLDRVKSQLNQTVFPVLAELLRNFILYKIHIEAGGILKKFIDNETASIQDTWSEVFCGGEGLYNALDEVPNEKNTYFTRKVEIDKNFLKFRGQLFKSSEISFVDRCYATLNSKAGLTGIIMALSTFVETREFNVPNTKKFIEALNKINGDQWVSILTDYKQGIVLELNPKLWPDMRNIFLRVIQNNSKEVYYKNIPVESHNPDYKFCKETVKRRLRAWRDSQTDRNQMPDLEVIKEWCENSTDHLSSVLVKSGLTGICTNEEIVNKLINESEFVTGNDDESDAFYED